MKVTPIRDRILVRRLEEREQKVGRIIIPDTAKEKPQQGQVIAVGKGRIPTLARDLNVVLDHDDGAFA